MATDTKRNAFQSVLMKWMNLEPIKHSEVSQKEKNNYRALTWNLERRYWWNDLQGSKGDTATEHTLADTVGKWDKLREQHRNITLPYIRLDSQCEFAAWHRELKSGALWQPRAVGGRFKREGTYAYLWLIHVDIWQKAMQYYKAIIPQLKINLH